MKLACFILNGATKVGIVNGDTIRSRRRPLLVTRSGQEIAPEDESFERLKTASA